jgi:thiamine pyrophosphate-dependent acetolactate synthase large subunit-like protein
MALFFAADTWVDRFDGEARKGCDILVQALEREGVDTVFAYPGGASMEIHQALTRSKTISNILCRHEQGEIFAAEGYAKATGRVGVCIATSGPGATNLVTGLADAMMDSVPLVAITGQVPRRYDALQLTRCSTYSRGTSCKRCQGLAPPACLACMRVQRQVEQALL